MLRKLIGSAVLGSVMIGCAQGTTFDLPSEEVNYGQNVWYNRKVDVVFIVDNSIGMAGYNEKLREKVPGLVNALLARGLDMHFAVITTSMGGANPNGAKFLGSPKFLTSASSNLTSELTNRIAGVGNDGSDLERGLDSLVRVMNPVYQSSVVPGFLREDSLVAFIALTSEDDKSSDVSGVSAFMTKLDEQVGFFTQDGGRRWTMNIIGMLSLNESCPSSPGTPAGNFKEPSVRMMTMAEESGGVKESICAADYSVAATNMQRQIVNLIEVYPIGFKPKVETIRVSVNGVSIPRDESHVNGWDYIPEVWGVKFYGSSVPAPGADVNVFAQRADAN